MKKFSKALFKNLINSPYHEILATQRVMTLIGDDSTKSAELSEFVKRYFSCDWGEDILNDPEDYAVNNSALSYGGRILGVYYIDNIKIFIMTGSYWETTQIMLADEY